MDTIAIKTLEHLNHLTAQPRDVTANASHLHETTGSMNARTRQKKHKTSELYFGTETWKPARAARAIDTFLIENSIEAAATKCVKKGKGKK